MPPVIDISKIQVRQYVASDSEMVRNYIHTSVRENHPTCQESLFDWLHSGFGISSERVSPLVLLDDGEVVGFRGLIPQLYQVPFKSGMEIVQGGSYAYWHIRQDYRGLGIGYKMQLETQRMMPTITVLGSSRETSAPIFKKNGFVELDSMHRFVVPLEAQGYHRLLSNPPDLSQIKEWQSIWENRGETVKPNEPDIVALADMWEKTTFPLNIFSIYRNPEFWNWRYINSKGFHYLFFGHAKDAGVVVARTEVVYSPESPELDHQKIFRIIEIVPREAHAWNRAEDPEMAGLISGCIRWAMDQGCMMADFFCSNTRFEPMLRSVGFRKQDSPSEPGVCSLPLWFQPLSYEAPPLNALVRVENPDGGLMVFDFENSYMVKSENDQDRPNLSGRITEINGVEGY